MQHKSLEHVLNNLVEYNLLGERITQNNKTFLDFEYPISWEMNYTHLFRDMTCGKENITRKLGSHKKDWHNGNYLFVYFAILLKNHQELK